MPDAAKSSKAVSSKFLMPWLALQGGKIHVVIICISVGVNFGISGAGITLGGRMYMFLFVSPNICLNLREIDIPWWSDPGIIVLPASIPTELTLEAAFVF